MSCNQKHDATVLGYAKDEKEQGVTAFATRTMGQININGLFCAKASAVKKK